MKATWFYKNYERFCSQTVESYKDQGTMQHEGRIDLTHDSFVQLLLFIAQRTDSSKHLNMCLTW